MKRINIIILFTILLSMVNTEVFASEYDAQIDGIYYKLFKYGEAWVFYRESEYVYGGSYSYFNYKSDYTGDMVIPESVTYEGVTYKVTQISSHACEFSTKLTSVTIPNSVRTIGGWAFKYCTALPSVTIPNSVTYIGESAFLGCGNIKTIVSQIEEPQEVSFGFEPFDESHYNNTTLYVPKGTIEKYMYARVWKNFKHIEELDNDEGGETPRKCATPTIDYQNGILTFGCETEGVTCQYAITNEDIKSGSGNEVQLGVTYHISVYATKTGYEDSETVTATLCWIDAEPKTEGITNVAQIRARAVMIQSNGNVVSVSGADEGTEISIYDIAGKKVGSSIATSDITKIATSLDTGSIAIIRIGEKAVKILIK